MSLRRIKHARTRREVSQIQQNFLRRIKHARTRREVLKYRKTRRQQQREMNFKV